MVSDVDFVKAAVEGGDPPPKDRTSLDDTGTIEGVPANQFGAAERAAFAEGKTLQTNDDGTPFDPRNPDKGEQKGSGKSLFSPVVEDSLFASPEPLAQTIAPNVAADYAYNESLINDDPQGFQERKDLRLNGNVMDATVRLTQKKLAEQGFADSGLLADEHFLGLDRVAQVQALQTEIARLDLRELRPMQVALIEAFRAGQGEVKMPAFEAWARQLPVSKIHKTIEARTKSSRRKAEIEVNETVAAQGWDSSVDAIIEIGFQDMLPIFPLISRWGVIDGLTDAAGVPRAKGFKGFLFGEQRQHLREQLFAMNPEEFLAAARAMKEQVTAWQADPVMSKLVTRYNILEQYEAIFTEDVYDGTSAKNTGDRWFGNVETFLEGIFSVVVVAKGAKGIFQAFNATDVVSAKTLATASDAAPVAAKLDESLQTDQLALDFGLEADEAVPAMLPRPIRFADDVENLPDGTKSVLTRNDNIRTEILESSDSITGQPLTALDKTNVVNASIKALDLADGAHVQGRMSSLSMMQNETGFNMRVVVGESAEGGYKNIQDAVDEALRIDPLNEHMRIMRINSEGVLEPVFVDAGDFARAAAKGEVDAATAGRILGGDTADETFYLTYDTERFWHSVDKEVFGTNTFQSGGIVPRIALSPNAKFGDEIYAKFLTAYMGEQKILQNFELFFEPYYKLGREDKEFVASAFEWMEDFGKNHGRAPTSSEVMARYDGVTEAQLNGMVALRDGMDTLHELFNRKLYRDWKAVGFKTAKPANSELPTFHGKVLERADASRGGDMLDPETGKMVSMSTRELDDLYNGGGRVMELDMAVDAANESRAQATRILLRDGNYKVGDLSTKPLVYHPGYSIRFYDDPYYIVKDTTGVSLNGAVRSGQASTTSDALRTAGTQAEAESFMRKMAASDEHKGVAGTTYKVVRANDITKTESSLFQKQSIHREGRLFWDNRNFDRLPDVNGNRATLEDPTKSLERGIGMAARQLTHEDLLKGIKNAWKNDYGNLISDADMLTRFDLRELSQRLNDLAKNTVDKAAKTRIKQSKELIDYMRLIEGTEQMIVPKMRELALSVATTVNRWTGAKSKGIEQFAAGIDPFRTMRSIAFNTFMVFRPVRQALLQGSQIGYLAALSPRYVASRQFFKDAYALKRGLTKLRKSGYDDGFSDATFAKSMNLTKKEYRVLLREFDRSGLVDLVDVHSFAGGAHKFRKVAGPKNDSIAGTIGYRGRQAWSGVTGGLQMVGFNLGENANLTFTYNLARKRLMDKKGYKSLLEITKKEWDELRVDASNLALGMVKPNNFGYQTGALGVATQFLSFSHKAALGLLNANPAIKGADTVKVLFGTYLLYGANMYGARDLIQEQLTQIGVSNAPIPGTETDLVDFLAGGLIDTTTNLIGDLSIAEWAELDLGAFSPGLDIARIWENNLLSIIEQPLQAAFGPFGNIASKYMTSYQFVYRTLTGDPDLPADKKFVLTANAIMAGTLPAYNDAMQSYMAWQMDRWYTAAGEPLPIESTMNAMIARGLLGVRTREEIDFYRLKNKLWEDKQTYNSIRDANRDYLRRQATMLGEKTLTLAQVERNISAMVNLFEEWPEGVRHQMLKDSMGELKRNDELVPSVYETLIDVLKDRRMAPDTINDFIDRFPSITPEQREQLRSLAHEAHESRVNVDEVAREEILNEN